MTFGCNKTFAQTPNLETPPAPQHRSENTSGVSAMLQRIQKLHWLRKREAIPPSIFSTINQVFQQEKDYTQYPKNPFTQCCCLTAPVHRQPVAMFQQLASICNSDQTFETPAKTQFVRSCPQKCNLRQKET